MMVLKTNTEFNVWVTCSDTATPEQGKGKRREKTKGRVVLEGALINTSTNQSTAGTMEVKVVVVVADASWWRHAAKEYNWLPVTESVCVGAHKKRRSRAHGTLVATITIHAGKKDEGRDGGSVVWGW